MENCLGIFDGVVGWISRLFEPFPIHRHMAISALGEGGREGLTDIKFK